MATTSECTNEQFDITNGVVFRWENRLPAIARHFGIEIAPRQKINLRQMMTDKGRLWERMFGKHALQPIPFETLIGWDYGDFVFKPEFDIISSMTKARSFGSHKVHDSEAMFLKIFGQLRTARAIP